VAFSPHAAKKPENPGTSKLETGPQILRRSDDGKHDLPEKCLIFQLVTAIAFPNSRTDRRTGSYRNPSAAISLSSQSSSSSEVPIMDIDRDRIDEAVLALLFLGRHDGDRTWKSFDWSVMERLHAKGLISNPISKTKSVVFTGEGLRLSEALFRKFFAAKHQSP
jgi:hypothetical protein